MVEDLRTRRRQMTHREIHTAVLRLAAEHGLDQITVDQISAEAGVSRRTFFNYFQSKEHAVVSGPGELPAEAVAEFLAGTSVEPAQVLRDLSRLLLAEVEAHMPDRDDLRQVFALAYEHPAVLALLLADFNGFEREVASVVARRLGCRPEDETPTLLAAIALTAVRTGLQRWSLSEQPAADSPVPHVERAVALLHAVLAT
ncbi:TetR family transcriptional regulator [Cryptosporangium phraense]|uniref:TetR family transcriptional regulator n=2 Tax=Cryptosporangium phraense TaxID=2593070 RepID=A0A545AV30_9ACTN|nr:TetR family transcriptional regulator [Cryptosporangium phraense]